MSRNPWVTGVLSGADYSRARPHCNRVISRVCGTKSGLAGDCCEQRPRIEWPALVADFEMKLGRFHPARLPGIADDLALDHAVALGHRQSVGMRIGRGVAVAVPDEHEIAVTLGAGVGI